MSRAAADDGADDSADRGTDVAAPAAPALRWLRVRRGGRSRTWRDHLYGSYLAALLVGVYVVPYLFTAARSGGGTLAPLLPHDPDTALATAVLAHALLAGLAVADGTRLGPVVVDPPTLHRLLGGPVSRPQVLRRRWWRATAWWTALGASTVDQVKRIDWTTVSKSGIAGPVSS